MGSKYKSPLIRSRNKSASLDASQTATPPPEQKNNVANSGFNDISVYDNTPQRLPDAQHRRGRGGFSSPRFGSPRPGGSPYQWTPPNRFNNSRTSDRNNSGSYIHTSPNGQNSNSPYRPQSNKYTKRNTNNYQSQSWNNENGSDESYFHPSMLEDPWAPLFNISANNAD